MTKKFLALLLIFFTVFLQAQYTEIINSNKPGFSQSPYSVGTGVYQFEADLFHRKSDASETFSNPSAWGLNLDFRTSFFLEKLELNLNTSIQQDKIAFKNVFESSYKEFGLGEFTIGAKYLAFIPKYTDKGKEIRSWRKRHGFDYKRWIPHVAGYVGINFGSFLNAPHERGGITPKVGVLLQNEFSNQFNVVTNVYYNYIGSDYPEWSYIVTGTYNFDDTWAGFVEHQANFNAQESTSNLGGGLAYLFSNDLQFNASLRATFQEEGLGVYASLGASYRLDRHQDEFVELDEFGNKIEEHEKETYNKGFFGRLFDKITGVFKKKDKSSPDLDTEKAKKAGEEYEPVTGRERKKSILDGLIKDDKKAKKKKTKEEERAERKAKRAEEKAQRKAEKAKRKEEKRKKKEQEKLEKEIKKLEKELKKEEEEELQKKYKEEKKKLEEKEEEKKQKKENKEETDN